MRLFVAGESRFGAMFLRAALAAGHEIVCACATGGDHPTDPMSAAAQSAGVPVAPAFYLTEAGGRAVRVSGAELLVLANVGRVLARDVLEAAPHGAICFHPSLLPRHRGKNAVRDALAAGDTFTGASVFWPDAGADTGPLLIQARVEITPGESPAALYHNKLVPVGVHCMLAAIAAIEAGGAPRIPQMEAATPPRTALAARSNRASQPRSPAPRAALPGRSPAIRQTPHASPIRLGARTRARVRPPRAPAPASRTQPATPPRLTAISPVFFRTKVTPEIGQIRHFVQNWDNPRRRH